MKRIVAIFAIIVLLVFTSCSDSSSNNFDMKEKTGLSISNCENYDWEQSEQQDIALHITSDGAIVGGDAKCNILIWLKDGVTTLCIDNLNQNTHKIEIWYPLDGDCNLDFTGENVIYKVGGCDNLTLYSASQNDELSISGQISTNKELNFSNGKFNIGIAESLGNINVVGNTNLYMAEMKHQNEIDHYNTRLFSEGTIKVDLDDKGKIEIHGEEFIPLQAESKIVLSGDTIIKEPSNGFISIMPSDISDYYGVYTHDDSLATSIIIQ